MNKHNNRNKINKKSYKFSFKGVLQNSRAERLLTLRMTRTHQKTDKL